MWKLFQLDAGKLFQAGLLAWITSRTAVGQSVQQDGSRLPDIQQHQNSGNPSGYDSFKDL